jgi:hypothetical protein
MTTHQQNVQQAEMVRQGSMAALQTDAAFFSYLTLNGVTYPTLQAALKAVDISFYRACLASAIANNITPSAYIEALKNLGTGGA